MIKHIMQLQRAFMGILDIQVKDELFVENIKSCALGLASEAGEVCQAINFKTRPWSTKNEHKIKTEIAEEAIDILFYLAELFIILDMNEDDVVRHYVAKLERNLARAGVKGKYSAEIAQSLARINQLINLKTAIQEEDKWT